MHLMMPTMVRMPCKSNWTILCRSIAVERSCRRAVLGIQRSLERARKFWSLVQVYLVQVTFKTQLTVGGF